MVGGRWARWRYRVWQFWMRLHASPGVLDERRALELLGAEGYRLFAAMSRGDRLHGLCVLARLERRAGGCPPELAAAALLHDVGKGCHLSLALRSLIVVLGTLLPTLLARLARADGRSWRHALYVHGHHAELGAALCERAGCAPATVALVRLHGAPLPRGLDPTLAAWLAALKSADDAC